MSVNHLPECWNDDVRMNVLFAPFRNRDVNPQDWDTKLQFWSNCIYRWCQATKHVTFRHSQLLTSFERNQRTPQCLRMVLEEMLRQKQIVRLSDLGNLEDDEKWLTWGLNVFVKRPLSWSVSALSNAIVKKETPEEDYVLIDALKDKAKEVANTHHKHVEHLSTDHVVELSTLWERCKDVCTSELELQVVLQHMRREKQIATYISGDIKLIKFGELSEKTPLQITEIDLGILRLKKARDCILSRINKLQETINRHLQEAQEHVREGRRPMAKSALRKKKMAEKALVKREVTLENIESILHNIQEVETDKMVVEAYETGVEGFKNTLAQNGISLDRIDDTMVAIQEVFDMQEEIENTMSQPIGGSSDDTSLLEDELEALLLESSPDTSPVKPEEKRPAPVPAAPRTGEKRRVQLDIGAGDALPDVPSAKPIMSPEVPENSDEDKINHNNETLLFAA